MTREVWRPIPGTNGKYEISNLGNVKSFVRKIAAVKAIFVPTENGKKVLTDVVRFSIARWKALLLPVLWAHELGRKTGGRVKNQAD